MWELKGMQKLTVIMKIILIPNTPEVLKTSGVSWDMA